MIQIIEKGLTERKMGQNARMCRNSDYKDPIRMCRNSDYKDPIRMCRNSNYKDPFVVNEYLVKAS